MFSEKFFGHRSLIKSSTMLHFLQLLVVALLLATVCASPEPQVNSTANNGAVVTVTSTFTSTVLASPSATESSSTTPAQPLTVPTSWLTITAARSGSPIHLLPMNAAGRRFYLGGSTLSYCPTQVETAGDCPPGNTTVVSLCGMVRLALSRASCQMWLMLVLGLPRSRRSVNLRYSRRRDWLHRSSQRVDATRRSDLSFHVHQGTRSIYWAT